MKGAYVLLIRLDEDKDLKIGALGMVSFPAGFYAYTGSSMVNLEKRVERHFREEKKMKWHIDHFLREAEVVRAVLFPSDEREECEINRMVFDMDDGTVVIKGFGSSDCSCETHLSSVPCKSRVGGVFLSMRLTDDSSSYFSGISVAEPPMNC
ncbi:MAG: GIY-YIG nuclease family protein, partial [Candidatus Thermoplasmatota archaeon]|nr:GIY-YIG nuclease family protein [Candidatus Thermoplasmatota archaeon]